MKHIELTKLVAAASARVGLDHKQAPELALEPLTALDAMIIGTVDSFGRAVKESEVFGRLATRHPWRRPPYLASIHKAMKRLEDNALLKSEFSLDEQGRKRRFFYATEKGMEQSEITIRELINAFSPETLEDWSIKWKEKESVQLQKIAQSEQEVSHLPD